MNIKLAIRRRPLCFSCVAILLLILIIISLQGFPQEQFSDMEETEVCLIGKVVNKEIKNEKQVFYLKDITFCDEQFQHSLQLNQDGSIGALIYRSGGLTMDEIPMGASVAIRGSLKCFSGATNPGEFDMRKYYYVSGYHFMIQNAEITARSEKYDWWREQLYRFRQKCASQYESILNEVDASIIKAMVLGLKNEMDRDVKSLYQKNGIAHILAISGLHVSIFGMGLYAILRKLRVPMGAAVLISSSFLICYGVMTLGSASTIRAIIMLGMILCAKPIWRTSDPPTTLAVAALVVILIQPYYFYYAGFWFSFMAIAGITFFLPAYLGDTKRKRMKSIWQRLLWKGWLALRSGIAISYFTVPLILYFYYEYPTYSVFLNLLIIPCMTILLYFAIFALCLSFICLPAGRICAWPCHFILQIYEDLCRFVQHLPGSNLIIGKPQMWQMLLFYGMTFLIVLFYKRIPTVIDLQKYGKIMAKVPTKIYTRIPFEMRKIPFFWKELLMMMAIITVTLHVRCPVKITLLDVGQGDGICIQTKQYNYMIDGGSTSKSKLMEYQLVPFLKSQGISRIDAWFITHPDEDHCNGLLDLLQTEEMEDLKIEQIVLPEAYGAEQDFEELISLAEEKDIDIVFMSRGDTVLLEKKSEPDILCLHPEEGYQTDNVNDYSLVLLLSYQDLDFLFTGDATENSEEAILKYLNSLKCLEDFHLEVLKVGHHGSETSSSQEFCDYFKPSVALISCGLNNSYGHPHQAVVDRYTQLGSKIFRTDRQGAIIMEVRNGKIYFDTFLNSP